MSKKTLVQRSFEMNEIMGYGSRFLTSTTLAIENFKEIKESRETKQKKEDIKESEDSSEYDEESESEEEEMKDE